MNYTFNVYYVDDMQIRLALIMLMERIIHIYSDVEAWYNVQSAAVYNLYPPKKRPFECPGKWGNRLVRGHNMRLYNTGRQCKANSTKSQNHQLCDDFGGATVQCWYWL